jgi:multicomponent K+:H+ antiporter subunit G
MISATLPLWVTIPGTVLLVLAGLTTLVGSLGLLRLPDFFSRMHGPSMTNTIGVGATLIASMLVSSALAGRPIVHELLITLFVTASAPITSIMLLQAALYRNKARRDVSGDSSPERETLPVRPA